MFVAQYIKCLIMNTVLGILAPFLLYRIFCFSYIIGALPNNKYFYAIDKEWHLLEKYFCITTFELRFLIWLRRTFASWDQLGLTACNLAHYLP